MMSRSASLRRTVTTFVIAVALFELIGIVSNAEPLPDPPSPASLRSWTFDGDTLDDAPAGFAFARTDGGRMGRWIVRAAADAPSGGKVLAQTDADPTSGRFALAVALEPQLRDVGVSVRCKPLEGKVDQACGLVFRYRDADNYYITRANPLEGNVRLYFVNDGRRKQIANWDGEVRAHTWNTLGARARGDHLVVSWNGTQVIDVHDATFTDAGRVGVWTKADSVTEFDDLSVVALDGSSGP